MDELTSHGIVMLGMCRSLAVYRYNVLVWSAKLDHQPCAVRVASRLGKGSKALPGLMVTLTDEGLLQVSYLGTEPLSNAVGMVPEVRSHPGSVFQAWSCLSQYAS